MLPNEIGPVAPVEIFVTIFTLSEPVVGCQSLARVAVDDDHTYVTQHDTLGCFNKFSFSRTLAVGHVARDMRAKVEASQEYRDCLLEDGELDERNALTFRCSIVPEKKITKEGKENCGQ